MDQVRKIFAWLKQYHFWVLSVLVALIGTFCWWSAAGKLSKQYSENQGKITAEFNNLQTVRSDTFHPNDEINKRQVDETNKLSVKVSDLWQKLHDAQREIVLKWPSGPGELNADFRDTVEKLEFGQEIPDDLREHYQNYIFRHFPELPKKIGARPIDENEVSTPGGGGGFSRRGSISSEEVGQMGMGGQLEDDNDYICEWAAEDQAAVRAELEFPQTPSPLRIWCTQENLWVYHALLDVIKNTNEAVHATRMSNAAVRGIYSLQVGQPAAQFSRTPNRIYMLPTAPTAEGGEFSEQPVTEEPERGPSEFPGGGGFTSGLAEGQGEMSEAQEAQMLLSYRYLGEDGKPIPAGGGGGEVATEPIPGEPATPAAPVDLTAFGKEYKRLPVRMVLEMDQRQLPRLIAECAMQPLQIEVQEVRVNAADTMGGASGGMSGMRSGFSEGGGMGAGNLIPDLTGLQDFNPHPEIVTVAIQGVIYIFNKPNAELLKPTAEDESLVQTP